LCGTTKRRCASGIAQGKEVGHSEDIQAIRLSADNRILFGRSRAGYVLFDLTTGQRRNLAGAIEEKGVRGQFSPDGNTLVTYRAEVEGRIAVWDVGTGKLRFRDDRKVSGAGFEFNWDPGRCAFSSDSQFFIVGLTLWDAKSGRLLCRADEKDNFLWWQFSADGRFVFVDDCDTQRGTLDLRDVNTAQKAATIDLVADRRSAAFPNRESKSNGMADLFSSPIP
jgi:WD40 repeat protein